MALDFLDDAGNVVLVGPNGVGKSTLAQNIAHQALIAGHTVLFTSAGQLLGNLCALDSDSALRRQASISVPSTEKCSSDSKARTFGWFSTASINLAATFEASRRSRFLVNTLTSQIGASIDKPANQRNSRLSSNCSNSCRSNLTE